MGAAATIATIRAAHGGKLVPHKMLTAGPAMTWFAENPDLINEIAFFQLFFLKEMQIYHDTRWKYEVMILFPI